MPSTVLRDRVAEILESLDVGRLDDFLAALDSVYGEDIVFRDPMQSARGLAAFREVNRGLARAARSIDFSVLDRAGDDDLFYLRWMMEMVPKLGPKLRVEGVSHLRGKNGRVSEHIDYWDLGELMATPLGGRKLMHLLFRPFV